jgi:hypothetical protein
MNLYGRQKAALLVEAWQHAGRDLTRGSLLNAIASIKDCAPVGGLRIAMVERTAAS